MQLALRPYVTPGVVIAGAALVAVNAAVPAAVMKPNAEIRQELHRVQHRPVQLTAGPDFFSPYVDLFNNTATNLVAMGSDNGWGNLIMQILTDPSSLARLPEVFDFLTNPMPEISGSDPMMVMLSPLLTIGLGMVGPLVTVNNAMHAINEQIWNPTNPLDPFAAMFTAPAVLLNAYLNGTDTLDIAGIHVPAWNGILAHGQSMELDLTASDLVNGIKIGDETIAGLLDQTGIGTLQISGMLTGLLSSLGLGSQTPVDLLNDIGLGGQQISDVAMTLFNAVGIGDPTVSDIFTQLGVGNLQAANVVIDFTHALGLNNPMITDITDSFGVGDLKLADLGMTVLDALGIGDPTVSGLLGTIGADGLTLNGLLNTAVDALGLGGQTPASIIDAFGGGDLTTHEVIGSLLNGLGLGNQTMYDLLSQAGVANVDIGDIVVSVLGDAGNTSMTDVLDAAGFADVTVKQLTDMMGLTNLSLGTLFGNLQSMGVIGNLTINDFIAATGGTPLDKGGDTSLISALGGTTLGSILADQGMLDSPLSALLGDMGTMTLADMIRENFAMPLIDMLAGSGMADMTLNDMVLSMMPDQPLADLLGPMGSTTLTDLINQMVPANISIVDMLNDAGIGGQTMSELLNGLFGDQTVNNALDDGGVGGMHLDDIISQALGTGTINDMLNQFGIGGQNLSDLFDQFFGTTTISDGLIDLGLGDQTLNELIDSLFGSMTVSSLLGDFGTQTVNELLASMGLGDLTVINAQIEEFFGSMAYFIDGLPNQIAAVLGA
ncbi:hypothetical protein [[Mycobacterium] crassicus]|uniref:PE-PGRS family protein n=1 Tax=[Mycobacterium] crassicus TaxID=2872309 RepID=A0ABU5XSB2_9MYCO|nr:hypothetical protein [Mycolicibacter sp. MYC098]MEB3024167.1 hypothetical protein [Mycolicibacter sp. MYC098]